MAIDFKRGTEDVSEAEAALRKEAEELKAMGRPCDWKAQYLLFRHDRATSITGREPWGAEIDEIQDRVKGDMGRIRDDWRKSMDVVDSMRSVDASKSAEARKAAEAATDRYNQATIGTGRPSPEGTRIADMPLFEAVHVYDSRHPGVIKSETLACLPGYGAYVEMSQQGRSQARTGRDVPGHLGEMASQEHDGDSMVFE